MRSGWLDRPGRADQLALAGLALLVLGLCAAPFLIAGAVRQ